MSITIFKVWDADTGMCFHSFGDGNAPVYGLCSHKDKNVYVRMPWTIFH